MPKQVGKSPVAGKFGGALAKSKGVPAKDKSFAGLPGGITNGVAKFAVVHRGTYKTGKDQGKEFVQLRAIVVSPKTAIDTQTVWDEKAKKPVVLSQNSVNIEGLQTSAMFPLCATGTGDKAKTEEENMLELINQVKLLGGDTCLEENGVETEEDFYNFLEALTKADIHFRFTTSYSKVSAEYPTPRVFENWGKAVSNGEVPEVDDEIVDNTEVEEEEGGAEETPDDDIPFDLDALAESADNESDEEAQRQLTELAEQAGVAKKKVENSASWADVATMIREKQSESEGEPEEEVVEEVEEEEEEEWKPEVKQVWFYKPKGKRKGIEAEVTAVFESKKTCNVKLMDGSKTSFKGVPWTALKESADE